MEDAAPQILKDQLVVDPGFPFLETISHPVFREKVEQLSWWHSAFLWEQRQMRTNPRRFAKVPGGSAKLLREPEGARRFAARRADEFVAAFGELLAYGALYFDEFGDLRAAQSDEV